jgi:hypothetical protein
MIRKVEMTTSSIKPGLHAADATSPLTPLAFINGTPIYPLRGARGGGIDFIVGNDDGPDPSFGNRDDDDDDEEEDEDGYEGDAEADEDPRAARRRTTRRDDDGATDWTPPTREAVQRMEAALQKANREAAKRRAVGKQMEQLGITDLGEFLSARGIDPETGLPYGDDVVDPRDTDPDDEPLDDEPPARRRGEMRTNTRETVRAVRAAEQRGRAAAMSTLTPILAQQAAENAMRAAGFTGTQDQLDRALRMIDARQVDVEIDEDGFDVVGIDEQVADIQDAFPQLFRQDEPPARRRTEPATPARRRRTGAAAVDGGERGRQPKKPLTWAEQMAEQLSQQRR